MNRIMKTKFVAAAIAAAASCGVFGAVWHDGEVYWRDVEERHR